MNCYKYLSKKSTFTENGRDVNLEIRADKDFPVKGYLCKRSFEFIWKWRANYWLFLKRNYAMRWEIKFKFNPTNEMCTSRKHF